MGIRRRTRGNPLEMQGAALTPRCVRPLPCLLDRGILVNVVNERPPPSIHHSQDPRHGSQEDSRRISSAYVAADHDKRSESRMLEGLQFQRPVSDPLVLCENNPFPSSDASEPHSVFSRLIPMIVVALASVASGPESVRHIDLSERTIDEEDDLRRLRSGSLLQLPPALSRNPRQGGRESRRP